jgi:hypothetical protein
MMSGTLQAEVASSSQPPSQNTLVKRTLCVNISGSLANLALAGPQAAMWKPVAGKETEMFCPTLESDVDPDKHVNMIRNGLIKSVTLKEAQSTFPCALGVSMSCVPSNEVTDLGEKYAYCVLPNSNITSPQVIFTCDASMQENATWRERYGKWNKSNLESEGTIPIPNQSYLFVHQTHPIIGLLRHNSELIGCDVDKMPKMDGQWFKITRQVMSECCNTLRTQVLNKVHTQDMNMFSLQLHRLNAETWDDLGDGTVALQGFKIKSKWSPEETESEKKHHLQQFMTNKYQYMARLEIEYEVPNPMTVA